MIGKTAKKQLKKIRNDIKKLQKEHDKMEFRPCMNDADLRQKEEDLKGVRNKIYELEKELDRYILNTGRIRHGV